MNFFHVYTHASGKTEYVRDGFTVGAFLFTFFYSGFKGLWPMTALLLTASATTYMLYSTDVVALKFYMLAELVIKLYAGFSCSDWAKRRLARKGFELADVVLAHSPLHAKLRYMERHSKTDGSTTAGASA